MVARVAERVRNPGLANVEFHVAEVHHLPRLNLGYLGAMAGAAVGSGLSMLVGFPQLPVPSVTTKILQVLLGMLVVLGCPGRRSVRVQKPWCPLLIIVILVPTAIVSALVVAPFTSFDVVTLISRWLQVE